MEGKKSTQDFLETGYSLNQNHKQILQKVRVDVWADGRPGRAKRADPGGVKLCSCQGSKCKAMKWSEVTQSCLTLWDPMDCSPPGSSVHGIFQARVLEWVVISFSTEDLPDSKTRSWSSGDLDRTQVSRTVGRRFTVWATNWHGKEDTKPLITFLKRLLIWPCESP